MSRFRTSSDSSRARFLDRDYRNMSSSFVLSFSLLFGIATATGSLNRKPRSLIQLGQVMQCATRNNDPLVYNCYGCYCGKGGSGTPVDAIDSCCFAHDQCYGDLEKNGVCNQLLGEVYLQPYEFDCIPKTITGQREPDNGDAYWPQCKKAPSKCGDGVCACDVRFANCLRQYKMEGKKKCSTFRLCL